ncbi:MAG: hypothetical protein HFF44_01105 [Lawsonibacter sp.]|nr:hypothetical protein [Lawsonibacter sp.]
MTDQELLQAIGQVVENKLEPMRLDIRALRSSVQRLDSRMDRLEFNMDRLESRIKQLESRTDKLEGAVHGIRVYMDTDQRRTMNLLLEGQQALWDRFVPYEEFDPLEDRTKVLEMTVKLHSQEIQELQLA